MDSQPLNTNSPSPTSKAWQYAEANVYTMTNPYTTREEKFEIEIAFQLPMKITNWTLSICGVLWTRDALGVSLLLVIPVVFSILGCLWVWYLYEGRFARVMSFLLHPPFVYWIPHVACGIWLFTLGHYVPGGVILVNQLTFCTLTFIPSILFFTVLRVGYKMHPKYALLKRITGRTFAFESASTTSSENR